MPDYLLMIVGDDDAYKALSEEESKELYAGHYAFMEAVRAAGITLGPSAELTDPAGARTLHADGVVTDGPFAESKEQVGGFYTIDVPTIDEAIEWARKIPMLPTDKIEVRRHR
ncbi:MAG TPA: YciI family protein [Mycobacteriales bacterium]